MARYITVPLLTFLFASGCAKSGAVIITPINTYTKKDIISKAEVRCRKYGMSPEEVRAGGEAWRRLVDEVVQECVYADLGRINGEEVKAAGESEPGEEEIRAKYDALLFSQKQYFSEKKNIVTAAIKYPRDVILYYPKGLKWVRLFTVPFESEVRGTAAILLSEGKTDEYEKAVASAEAAMDGRLRDLRRRLESGRDFEAAFDEAAAEYGGVEEALLYDEDTELFPARLAALRSLKKIGDMAEYNVYQGHVFMVFSREPEYVEVPYEAVRSELVEKIKNTKAVIQRDLLMKKLYEDAVANGSVKVRTKKLYRERGRV